MELDEWQKQIMDTKGNLCLRSGRQVGKSTIISIKAAEYALANAKKTIMVIASVDRQSLLLFEKILNHIHTKNKNAIKTGKHKPTKHKIQLKNGSVIHSLPTGESGYGIRGFTIDLLIADEAAFIPEEVWTAVTPMLTVTRGDIWLLSTPYGNEGFFYRCFQDNKYTSFHVSSEDCPRKDQDFLDHEKSWMTKAQYAQEYLGEFVDELRQFFPTEVLKKVCLLKREDRKLTSDYYLGVDIAGMGKDDTTLEILEGTHKENVYQVENIIRREQRTTDTTQDIIDLDNFWSFKKIGVDDGGMGVGVYDQLSITNNVKRKVVGLNNASRPIDREGRKKKLLKEDMYNNLLAMMERSEIALLDDDDIIASLKSIQFDIEEQKIFGRDTHIAEGLIRAAWLVKNKSLNIWIR
jgi:hypothetical protein